ncbi:MAG TPA: hypothetical protein VMB47_01365 [Candidatus Aquilonibacter sp.]|nr:hypothetical protein [Candidatus Aquilonibacter sp.]
MPVIALLSLCLPSATIAARNPPAHSTRTRGQDSGGTPVAGDRYFEFHSGFWVNLHLFLLEEAITRMGGRKIGREAEFTHDSSISATLSGTDKTAWDAAIAYYQENLIGLDLVTSDRMRIIKNTLENFENEDSLRLSGLDPRLIHVLDDAAPVYRAHWWTYHDNANRTWIASAVALADQDGNTLSQDMAQAYETPWPVNAVRVDVVAYANDSGAFTTLLPTRITVSSLDPANQKLTAEEVLFHEGSHALVEKIGNEMLSGFAEDKKKAPPDLLHAILYFTAGYFVKEIHSDYIPYAEGNGLWQQPSWKGFHDVIEKDWLRHLQGQSSAGEAISAVVRDVVAVRSNKSE